jgi:glucose-1-phosphate thymidylyltransferase
MKGILLAGGSGTRLAPLTWSISKQLLPIYNKPLIYYPLTMLMYAGVRDILVISTPRDTPMIEQLMGDGNQFGLQLSYAVQEHPRGIAEAFLIAEERCGGEPVCLVLGDNIFHGHELPALLDRAARNNDGATVFACHVSNPTAYGVVTLDHAGRPIEIEEKPVHPKSDLAVAGLYFYDSSIYDVARGLRPSARGELEITDVNRHYLTEGRLSVQKMGRGTAWFDAGTFDSMLSASQFVQMLEAKQGLMIGLPEEVAFRKGFISVEEITEQAELMKNSPLGDYLRRLLA